MHDRKE
jgi:hypothetical protein